jgi:hypothetical protein
VFTVPGNNNRLGAVAYIYNPSYLGGRDREDLEVISGKKLARSHLNK